MVRPGLLSFLLSIPILTTTHIAAYSSYFYRVVASGRPIEMAPIGAINPDCSSVGRVSVNLLVAPQGGDVRVGEGRRYLFFGPNNPRSACNHRKVPASFVIYQSHPGFVGQDSFVIEIISPDGLAQRSRLYVTVR